ncbi:MAG: iron ABC transporter substrate-binding protein [Chloroflexi bacterium]|nr:iron ABC transporter substrate-binding protein [Chloroflexota bacterium]
MNILLALASRIRTPGVEGTLVRRIAHIGVLAILVAGSLVATASCGGSDGAEPSITVYSARSQQLVGKLFDRFQAETGIDVQVRYGGSGELASTILEEGENSPADLFFAQDAGALGALEAEGVLRRLPDELLRGIDSAYQSQNGVWVGVSGRARSVVFNSDSVEIGELPLSILGFTDPVWKGRIGWPPTNASFLSFVTALRVVYGEDQARDWLRGIIANQPHRYKNNSAVVQAVGVGEVDVGFANHYYLYRFLEENGPEFPAANYFPPNGDLGAMVNVAGVGVLAASDTPERAVRLVEYLLSPEAQKYFADTTYEFPLVPGIPADPRLPSVDELQVPDLKLGDLKDIQGTLDLMREIGMF